MIADFRFVERPRTTDVVVRLSYARNGARQGVVIVPASIRPGMIQRGYPTVDDAPLPLSSALAFALNVAMNEDLALSITGDPSVWDPVWGTLIERSAAGVS